MELEIELEAATRAARIAGEFLVGEKNRDLRVLSDKGRDIKLATDRASEELIVNELKLSLPYPILAEERGEEGVISENSTFWIVDPLDGTMNFSRGIDYTCVSIALWKGQTPLLGVIHDFNRGETFHSVSGGGAFCNGVPIQVSNVGEKDKSILVTGFPSLMSHDERSLTVAMRKIGEYKKVRMIGSATLSLALVACGRADAYFEEDVMLWDVAAGLAIISEAGGVYTCEQSPRSRWARRVKAAAKGAVAW